MRSVSESTKVNLSIVLVALGAVGWITKLWFLTESNAETLKVVAEKQDSYSRDVAEIKADLKYVKQILTEEK